MAPVLHIEDSEGFGVDRVTVGLHWTQEIHQGSACILPCQCCTYMVDATLTMSGNTRAILTLPYNAPYNVSVVADFCGRRNVTTLIELSAYIQHIALFDVCVF